MHPPLRAAAAVALLLLTLAHPAIAGEIAGEMACFPPSALAPQPGEERVQRHVGPAPLLAHLSLPAPTRVPASQSGSIRRVTLPEGVRLVALTFDLCEASSEISGYDGAVISALREARVPATFFAGGKWLTSHPARGAQLIADPLFEMGNHTWSHANLAVRGGEEMRRQVDDADIAIAETRNAAAAAACRLDHVPQRATLFRFPYGSCSREALDYVNDTGHLAIQWDVDSGDPALLGAKTMAAAMLKAIRPGSIVLMHANGRGKHTAEAVRLLLPALKAQGYRLVTVSALLKAGTPVIASTCYSERPGDTQVYDAAARAGRHILPLP